MRSFLVLIALLTAAGYALADNPDNPYAAAGISDPAHVTQFIARLQSAVAVGDRAAVVAMLDYPLRVYAPGRRLTTYYAAAALKANYAQVFTPEVVAAIATATPDNLFVRDQGVMVGNGEVWMREVHGAMRIIAINHTR